MPRENIHTVFDRMAAKGVFRANPANQDSVDANGQSAYQGPVQFPKMVYHPKGASRITVQAEMVATPFGPTMNNQQKEIINKLVNSKVELDEALKAGWHQHPSDAIAAGLTEEDIAAGVRPPPKGAASRITSLEAERDKLAAELAEMKAAQAKNQITDDSDKEED